MQARGDSASALNMLPALKGKNMDVYYDKRHSPEPRDSQQQQQHSSAQRMCLAPAEIYEHIADVGQEKQANSWMKEVVLGILAGAFIGFGFTTCLIAAGQVRWLYGKRGCQKGGWLYRGRSLARPCLGLLCLCASLP